MKVLSVILVAFFIFLSADAVAQAQVVYSNQGERLVDYGIGIGSTIAIVVSWSQNKSIAFAILHGILGWLYVIYYLITTHNNGPNNS